MVNEKVLKNFNDNIEYLQTNQKDLFSKLASLDEAIEKGYYKEKYELVYENGYFDVFETKTKNFLYAKSSVTHAKLASQSIDYELKENLFKGFYETKITKDELNKYKEKKTLEDPMSGYAPILHYTQEHSSKDKKLTTIDKFVFFGVGLGLHIESMHKQLLSKVYFIVEDDLELFRLSLFTINYASLASNAQLIFSVFEDKDEFSKSSSLFLDTKYYYNHYIKYFHLLSHSEEKITQFLISTTTQPHFSFDYNVYLTQALRPLDYIFNDYKFLNKTLSCSDEVLDKKSFLLLGAGPSLQKNIKWLRKNHDKFIIIAVSAIIEFLEKENIFPDIIVHLDAYEASIGLFKNIKSMDFIQNSICFFSDKIASEVINLFDKKNIFLFENGTSYKDSSIKPSASCVGSITYQLLLILKAKNIYLLGLDLALDPKTGKTHIDSYVDSKTISIDEKTVKKNILNYGDSFFSVEGNLSKEVFINPRWQTSIDTVNLSTQLLKKENQNIFNLSDGAKFIDVDSKKSENISVKNISGMKKLDKYLFNKCLQNSSKNLNSVELNNLNQKLLHANEFTQIIIRYKNKENQSLSVTLQNIIELKEILTNEDELKMYELSRVIDLYFRYILSYIFDFVNSNKLEKKEYHIQNIYTLLLEHILEIVDYYSQAISAKL